MVSNCITFVQSFVKIGEVFRNLNGRYRHNHTHAYIHTYIHTYADTVAI
jgi:hypothetical protein